jgi:DNA-binding transcriptional MerR regulator
MAMETELWTIQSLKDRWKDALSTGYQESANGQVSAILDARTIRYYSTLGLVDKPAEMRGRTAYYGRHHLLQLVAIKRLQAQGLRLAQVQEHLAGISDEALEELSEVPAFAGPASREVAPAAASARRESFWSAPTFAEALPRSPSKAGATLPGAAQIGVSRQLKLELAPGVHVLVDTTKIPDQADREVLAKAGQGLLHALRACGLHEPRSRR